MSPTLDVSHCLMRLVSAGFSLALQTVHESTGGTFSVAVTTTAVRIFFKHRLVTTIRSLKFQMDYHKISAEAILPIINNYVKRFTPKQCNMILRDTPDSTSVEIMMSMCRELVNTIHTLFLNVIKLIIKENFTHKSSCSQKQILKTLCQAICQTLFTGLADAFDVCEVKYDFIDQLIQVIKTEVTGKVSAIAFTAIHSPDWSLYEDTLSLPSESSVVLTNNVIAEENPSESESSSEDSQFTHIVDSLLLITRQFAERHSDEEKDRASPHRVTFYSPEEYPSINTLFFVQDGQEVEQPEEPSHFHPSPPGKTSTDLFTVLLMRVIKKAQREAKGAEEEENINDLTTKLAEVVNVKDKMEKIQKAIMKDIQRDSSTRGELVEAATQTHTDLDDALLKALSRQLNNQSNNSDDRSRVARFFSRARKALCQAFRFHNFNCSCTRCCCTRDFRCRRVDVIEG